MRSCPIWFEAGFILLACHMAHALSISNFHAQQRYPWNGKVDLTFRLDAEPSQGAQMSFSVTCQNPKRNLTPTNWTLNGGAPFRTLRSGTHTITWDSSEAFPNNVQDVVYTLSAHPITLLEDATGEENQIFQNVAIITLATGQVNEYPRVNVGTLNCDTYKTDKLALVKIEAGTYYVANGHANGQILNDARAPVIFSQPYYMGIFEVTRIQYRTVLGVGADPTKQTTVSLKAPVQNLQSTNLTVTTSEANFITALNRRIHTHDLSFAAILPSEAQWDVASRAGAQTCWFWGSDGTPLGPALEYAWVGDNARGKTQEVGLKLPNPWGLYDIYGNAGEWVMNCEEDSWPPDPNDPNKTILSENNGISPSTRYISCGGYFTNPFEPNAANQPDPSKRFLRYSSSVGRATTGLDHPYAGGFRLALSIQN